MEKAFGYDCLPGVSHGPPLQFRGGQNFLDHSFGHRSMTTFLSV